jgi:hypothetical protein
MPRKQNCYVAAATYIRAMGGLRRTITGELWLWQVGAGWTFLTLPLDVADEIRATSVRRGFGSVRVEATLGSSTWKTSVFPDSKSGSYVLPVKAQVRKREAVGDGDPVTVTLQVLE